MPYKVDYRAMDSLHDALSKSLEALDDAMTEVESKVNSLISSGNIAGATADRMRLYFSDVHCKVINSIHKCIDSVLLLFGVYVQNYHDSVDAHPATVIDTDELESILNRIIQHADDGTVIDNDVRKVIADIAGLYAPSSSIVETDVDIYNQLVQGIQSLCDAIQNIETDSKDALESTVAEQIGSITRYLQEQLQNQAMYKQNYVASSRSAAFYEMENGTLALSNMLSVNAQLVQSVAASKAQYASDLQAYDKEMAERKAREEQVKAAKTAVLITTIAVTAAVTVATGGVGTAFIVGSIAAGTATGALSGGVDEWGAQYIENGNNIDWSKVGRKAVVGGIKGGIKSGITAGFGAGFDKVGDLASVSSLTHSSSAIIQHGSKLGLKVAEGQVTDITSGIFDRFIDSGFEQWTDKGGKISFDIEKATHDALDKTAIAKDSAGSLAKSVTSYGATEMMNNMLDVEKITKDTVITGDTVKDSVFVTMISKTTSGIAERGTSTFTGRMMDGETITDAFSAAMEDATDRDKIGTDMISGMASGSVSPYTAKAKAIAESKKPGYIDFKETGNTNREREILDEMDRNEEMIDEDDNRRSRLYANSGNTAAERRILAEEYDKNAATKETPTKHPSYSEAMNDKNIFEKYERGLYDETELGKAGTQTLKYTPNAYRNAYAQRTAGGEDRRPDDQGGHGIAVSLGGSPDKENIGAQNKNLNQGAYKNQEMEEIKQVKDGDKGLKHYEAYTGGQSERPSAYMGYTITEDKNGIRHGDAFSYTNESSATQEQWTKELESMPDTTDIPDAMQDENYERIHQIADEDE